MSAEFPFGKMKKVLEMEGGDGYTNVNVLHAIQLYTQKWLNW